MSETMTVPATPTKVVTSPFLNEEDQNVLNLDQILQADDLKHKDIAAPEWGHEHSTVRLRVLSAGEAIQLSKDMKDPAKRPDALIRIVAMCAIKADGTQLIVGPKALEAIRKKSVVVFTRLQREALILNGMLKRGKGEDDDSAVTEEEVEAALKND